MTIGSGILARNILYLYDFRRFGVSGTSPDLRRNLRIFAALKGVILQSQEVSER